MTSTSKTRAFSLIELMVVVAIVAVLAIIAVPAYRSYSIKTKVANYYTLLKEFQNIIVLKYNSTGRFPASIVYNDIVVPTGVDTYISSLGIDYVHYRFYNDVLYTGFTVQPSALGLPSATYNLRSGAYPDAAGIFKFYCGTWIADDTDEIPTAYRPSECKCTNMLGVFAGTKAC